MQEHTEVFSIYLASFATVVIFVFSGFPLGVPRYNVFSFSGCAIQVCCLV